MKLFIILLLVACSTKALASEPEVYETNVVEEESFGSEELMLNMTSKFMNVESFDKYLGMGTFLQMIPKEIGAAWEQLNETQKEEVVTFISDVLHKRFVLVEGPAGAELLRQRSPAFYQIVDSLNNTLQTHLNNLKPETHAQLQQWRDEAADLFGSHRPAGETTAQNLMLIRDYFIRIRNMKPEIRADLKKEFPWTMSIVEGNGFKLYISVLTLFKEIFELLGMMTSGNATPVPTF